MNKSMRKSRKIIRKSVRKSSSQLSRQSITKSRKSVRKSVRKSSKQLSRQSVRKSVGKSEKNMSSFSILVKPFMFDNETIKANTKKANIFAISHLDKVKRWFKKHGKIPIKGMATVVKIETEGDRLRFIFDKRPDSQYINDYVDPDDDGNYPVIIDGKMMLISGKIVKR